jgi:diguanylate cyclase (GGDEF)-like protein/PAS domain S-box-containing protein
MFSKNQNHLGWMSKDFQARVKRELRQGSYLPKRQGKTPKTTTGQESIQYRQEELQEEVCVPDSQIGESINPSLELSLSLPESLEAIASAMPVPLLISRVVDGVILFANSHYCETLNFLPGEILGSHLSDIYPNAEIYQQWQGVLNKNGQVTDYEIEVQKGDRTSVWMAISGKMLTFEGDRFLLTTFTPINRPINSPTKNNAESDENLQTLIAKTASVIGVAFFAECARCLSTALGVRDVMISELIGKKQDQLQVLAFSQHGLIQSNFTYLISETPCEMAIKSGEFTCPEGVTEKFPQMQMVKQWVGAASYFGIELVDSTKKTIGVLCILDDKPLVLNQRSRSLIKIFAARTAAELERHQIAKVRLENETRLHLALKAAHKGVWDWDLTTGIITWSKEVAWILGFPLHLGQGPAKTFLHTIHPEDRYQVEAAIASAISEGTEYHVEYRIIHALTGQIHWIACDANIVCELSDRDVRIMGTISDISQRKETESALIQSEANLRAIFNSSTQGILLIDISHKIQAFNPKANQIIKLIWQKNLEQGQSIDIYLMTDKNRKEFQQDFQYILKGNNFVREKKIEGINHKDYWFKLNYHPVFDASGKVMAVCLIILDITEEKKAVDALINSEERFRSLVQNSSDIITILEQNGMICYESPSITRILGYDPDELLGHNAFDYIHPEDRDRTQAIFVKAMETPGSEVEIQLRFRHANGHWVYLESIGRNWQNDPKINGFVVNSRDISDRRAQEERLQLLERAIAASKNGVTITDVRDNNRLVYVNPGFEKMTGYSAADVLGSNCRFLQGPERNQPELDRLRAAIKEGKDCTVVLRNYRKDGSLFWNELQLSPVYNGQNQLTHFIGIQTDISDRKKVEEQLTHQAFHDPLTDLANRSLLIERLQKADLKAQQNPGYLFALLFLDLDRFKVVNDSLGHAVGDLLLIVISLRLQSCLKPSDTLARIGGDHFVILLEDIQDTSDAIQVAEQIHEQLQEPFTLKGHEFFISGSIGIALSSMGYERPADLLRDADIAMYRAKQSGKAKHAVFDKAMHDRVLARLNLENELRHTIEAVQSGASDALWLAYQPIVCLRTGKLKGFEALVRWHHPEQGFISPAEFIPIAEESGLIIPLGMWILRQACRQLQEWQSFLGNGHATASDQLTMSINLSGKQFLQLDLIQLVDEILAETDLVPYTVKLEITETVIVENMEYALETLSELRKRQILLSLDDFGTGYSSLSYLHQFPLDTLKIDRSFVNCIHQESKHRKIIQAIVTLAHALGMNVTAEGLETTEQLQQLKMLDCELGQGYFFSKPLDRLAASRLLLKPSQWSIQNGI